YLYLLGVAAIALYFAQSDVLALMPKSSPGKESKLPLILAALWPAVWLASALPIVMVEWAYRAVALAPSLEVGRIRDAMLSGFGLACALIFAFAMAYVSSERDKKVDFSYFRTTRPGDSTRNIVRTLKQPVQVGLFFPPANEVADRVKSYFDDLKRESTLLEVSSFDFAVDPAKAKELGATGNGIVTVTRQGGRREALNIGLELEAARTQLRTLDKEVNRRLLLVSRTGHTVFLTTGHSERSPERPPGSETDKRATIKLLRDLLVEQGY